MMDLLMVSKRLDSFTQAYPDTISTGWGNYLASYLNGVIVVNKAIGGRSARSYTNEGRFAEISKLVQKNDIVIIEFGHNDSGSPKSATDNGRADCPGTGSEVCISGKDGSKVYTFNKYISDAARMYIAAGASVIISSQTPDNLWETGTYSAAAPRFVNYAALAAKSVGEGAYYVDHFTAVADMYKKLGDAATNALYPKDHTHTSPKGANLSANAFAQAVKETNNPLAPLVKQDINSVY
jgi:rhamnogalacturonan acetylesterase